MKKIFFTPGPSHLYPTVANHIQSALEENFLSLSHRSKRFDAISQMATDGLQELLGIPKDYQIFFLSSANEAWERILQNCVENSSFHFVNGSFSEKFWSFSQKLGKVAHQYEVPPGEGFDFTFNIPDDAELIAFVANETSTGVQSDSRNISELRGRYPNKLIAVDCVSAFPNYQMDFAAADLIYFSSQKGFGLPAGLGVLIVSPAAMKKSVDMESRGIATGTYHSFRELSKKAEIHQTPETPNMLNIYLLAKVVEDFLRLGIDTIRSESRVKSEMLYSFFEGRENAFPFVKRKEWQSETVVVLETPGGSAEIISKLGERGLIIGSGYLKFKQTQIRISNFPAHSIRDMENLLSALKEVL